MRILVVEDDTALAGLLHRGLQQENHEVSVTHRGRIGLRLAKHDQFDVIILDCAMTRMGGFEVLCRLRRAKNSTPVLMVAERDKIPKLVGKLYAGTEDFIIKPFSFVELLARVDALARRAQSPLSKKLHEAGHVRLDANTRRAFRGEHEIHLTPTEYRLLELFIHRQGAAVSRRSIGEALWGLDSEVEDNTLDAFVRLLRRKIELPGKPRLIQTVRGFGFRLQGSDG